ncbi:MAG: exodeoxyribonuclease III [Clostridia bacterium]|nr:exodeoxyribonuclease III [Clostridia bacterium]
MKLVSWSVNGLRARVKKGFEESMLSLDADAICLQEIKLQKGQADIQLPGYEGYFNFADRKGYSGTAIYTRVPPISVVNGIGIDEHDHEGRVITAEYETFYLVCCYTPNAQDQLKRLEYRMAWEDAFRNYLIELGKKKPVVLCGDLNVAHCEIDLANPKTNHFNPGFSDEERGKFSELLASGFTDTFRMLHPDTVKYSWWSYRFNSRARNVGWRIDYFVVSKAAEARVKASEIHNEIEGSDHCPVSLVID